MGLSDKYYLPGVFPLIGAKFLHAAVHMATRCDAAPVDTQSAQVLAAIATEAFFDEMAFMLCSPAVAKKAPNLLRIGEILSRLEDSHLQIGDKYVIASQLLPGEPFADDRQPFQAFKKLVSLRNSLVHPKLSPKPPNWFNYFIHHELTAQRPDEKHITGHWMRQLETKPCAIWACRAAGRMVNDMIARLNQPCVEADLPGLFETLKCGWEWSKVDKRIWAGDATDQI